MDREEIRKPDPETETPETEELKTETEETKEADAQNPEDAGQEKEAPVFHTPQGDEAFNTGEFLTFAPLPREEHHSAGKKKGRSIADLPAEDYLPTGSDQPPSPEQLKNDRVVRLAQVRRRRAARRARMLMVVTLLMALAIAWALGAFGSSLATLSDTVDSIRIGLMPGEGFPVKTNIPEIYQVEELAGGFVELGSQDLVAYSASGVRLRSIQHNYSRPAMTVGDTRFCVYGRTGSELRVESRQETLYTKTTDQPLLLCAMAKNGSLAVVTRSDRYAAELDVYSPNMEYLYGWNPSEKEGVPSRVAFADNASRLAVACVKAKDGELTTGIYFLDTSRDSLLSSTGQENALVLELFWLDGETLLAVYQNHAAVYNALTGAEKARYEFGEETLLSASAQNKTAALLFSGGSGTSQEHLVVLDDRLDTLADLTTRGEGIHVLCARDAVYVLEETGVACYETTGTHLWTARLQNKPLALVDGKKMLVFTGEQADALKVPAQN